jgi:pimeloyl-ACP methyl ester carboxylesterase
VPETLNVTDHFVRGAGGVPIHYVAAGPASGDRPPVVLLHGFPEFWYGWRQQIPALAAAGFHAVAPDLRGYNRSGKPPRVRDYRTEVLVADVLALVRHVARRTGRANIVGHDWGGVVAWHFAMRHPEAVERLVILNAPHPAAYLRELRRSPAQLRRSWYVGFFQLPWLPEALIRFDDFAALRRLFERDPARRGAFTRSDIERYILAFAQPNALSGAINYYRAVFREGPTRITRAVRRIDVPTLAIWGQNDRYLIPQLASGLEPWVTDLRVERLERASHWVQHDEPEAVNRLLLEFLSNKHIATDEHRF